MSCGPVGTVERGRALHCRHGREDERGHSGRRRQRMREDDLYGREDERATLVTAASRCEKTGARHLGHRREDDLHGREDERAHSRDTGHQ